MNRLEFRSPGACLATLALLVAVASAPTLCAQGGNPAGESDAKAIEALNRYIEAIGGRENLTAIRDKVLRFDNKKFSPTGVVNMKMARFQKRDYKIREEWELPGMGLTKPGEPLRFLQVYDGDQAWVKAMGYVSALTGKTLSVFVWDKAIDEGFLHWEADGYTARWIGETEINNRPAEGVEMLAFAGGQRVRSYFALEDGLLIKKEWTENVGTGLTKKEVLYSEYLRIPFKDDRQKWIQMATIEQVYEDGELSLEKSFTVIRINAGLDDKIFNRPEGPAFEDRAKDGRIQSQPATQPKTPPKKNPPEKTDNKPKGKG